MQICPDSYAHRENRCPDCLFFDLQTAGGNLHAPETVALHLTLNFNEQWEPIVLGKVKFGLRGGELRLKLNNGRVPYQSRSLVQELPLSVTKNFTLTNNHEVQCSGETSILDSIATAKISSGSKNSSSTTEISEVTSCQVSTKGSVSEPVWVFCLKALNEDVLLGLVNKHLCNVHIDGVPCNVEARFQVSRRDVWILDAEGIWPRHISSNQRAVIEREIVFHLLSSRLQPYLSRVVLSLAAPLVEHNPENTCQETFENG